MARGGEDGCEVGLGDGEGEFLGEAAFVLEGLGEGLDAEAGFNRVMRTED